MNKLQCGPMLLLPMVMALIALASAQRYEPLATKNPISTPSTTTTITRKTTATTSPYATTLKRTAVPVRTIADTSKVKRQFPPPNLPPNLPPNFSPYVGDAFAGPRPSDLLFQYAHTGPDGSAAYGFATNEMEQHDETIITADGVPERRGSYTIQFPDKSEQRVVYVANQFGYQPDVTDTKGPGGVPIPGASPPIVPIAAAYPPVQPLYAKKEIKVEEYGPGQSPYIQETQVFASSTASPVAAASTVQPFTYTAAQQSGGGFYAPFHPSQPAVSNWNDRVVPIGQRPLNVQPLNAYRIPEPHPLYGGRGPPPPPPPPQSHYPYGGAGPQVPPPHLLYNYAAGHVEAPHNLYGNTYQPPPSFLRGGGGSPGVQQPHWYPSQFQPQYPPQFPPQYPPQYPRTVQPAQFPVNGPPNTNIYNYSRQATILKCTDETPGPNGNVPPLG